MKQTCIRWVAMGAALAGCAIADNPVVTDFFTADPAPLVHGGRVYMYVGQDEAKPGQHYVMNRWLVYSSSDLVNWASHGSPLKPTDFEWSKGAAWAGHVIEKGGKFYWFTTSDHRDIHGKAIGVAVSDSPTGPFRDARGSALVTPDMTTGNHNHSWEDIDPAVFTDKDGTTYLFWGNRDCYWARLKSNLTELDGEIHHIPSDELMNFTEAPWIHERDGLYYLSYASGFPEKIAYSVAKKITGPWKPAGLLAEGAQNSNTIHQGIIEFKGKWYFFYHSGMMQHPMIGGSFRRSACIDYLYYNPDGTMKRIVQTSEGVAPVAE